ncbi:glycosyltransferase family 2 protein [Collinsella tanakaei]|uniref:glycosyltransferase family 2 protein n=1 Tax=Collinsella tanakaei TaxID=626935 RepID=UPI001DBB67ED|nr:glycosyltransferase family 2 protein [Collinsella tanakaei]MBM6777894.1 glycosyltransferase family 2 protein [Collinsella tanakaei]
MGKPSLCIVIPCYNEQEVLPITAPQFKRELELLQERGYIADDSCILFVNDGSSDTTWEIIESLAKSDPVFRGICLSRNRGHQNALLAGLMECRGFCDVSISIDCDGQDDIGAMEDMLRAYLDGCDVVYGVRSSRATDTFFKRTSAQMFYKLMNGMGVETVYNHADYRLLSRRVLDELSRFEEVNLFLRGMVPLVGFKSTSVYYERHERLAGESHYPLSKMLALALNGITSLSVKPIRLITGLGFIVSLISFIGVIWAVIVSLLGHSVAGWASMVSIVCFIGGIQLLGIGIVGEYVGRIYLEAKRRPRFIVSERTFDEEDDER